MKSNWSGVRSFMVVGLLLANASLLFSAPRPQWPPWPEQTLGIWGFDHWQVPQMPSRTAIGIENAQFAESWSGYALVRDALAVSPVAIPVLDPHYHKRNFTTTQGTIRFWFCPGWSSMGTNGVGPGNYARLLELVSLYGNQTEVLYSLYLSPDGNLIYLSGQGVNGPMDFLRAEVNWSAGDWHLVSLAYDEKQTTLSVDSVPVATGPAFPPVAAWKTDALALVIGSDLAAGNPAQGQFEELCTFDYVQPENDAWWYWRGYRWTTMLGPVTTEREELKKQQWLAAMWAAELGTNAPPTETLAYRARPEEYPTNALWLDIGGVTNGVVTMRLQGTVPDVMYEILSQENFMTNAGWQSEGVWIGTADQDWTETPIQVGVRTNQLFLWARSYQDSTGNGLPDWWQLQYFGEVGVDGYADPDGDGWVNVQEYQNGTHPQGFNTPAAPQGVAAKYLGTGFVEVKWSPNNGSVTGYTVARYDDETWSYTYFAVGQSNVFLDPSFPPYFHDGSNSFYQSFYTIQAHYDLGDSDWSEWVSPVEPLLWVPVWIGAGHSNEAVMVVGRIPPGVNALRLTREDYDYSAASPYIVGVTNFVVTTNQLQGGKFFLGAAAPPRDQYSAWYVQPMTEQGIVGENYIVGATPETLRLANTQLAENLAFNFRAASRQAPFRYNLHSGNNTWAISNAPNYAYAGLYDGNLEPYGVGYPSAEKPFEDNYFFRNAVFSDTNLDYYGALNTGVSGDSDPFTFNVPLTYTFDLPSTTTNIPSLLATAASRWMFPHYNNACTNLGIQVSGTNYYLPTGITNYHGLALISVKLMYRDANGLQSVVLNPGNTVSAPASSAKYFYPEFAAPSFAYAGHYFGRMYDDEHWTDIPHSLLPGQSTFQVTNTSPLLFASIGVPTEFVAMAKYQMTGTGEAKLGYLGQYFDKAFKADANGARSTNETGVLSPLGKFVPTETGKVFLTTREDALSTNTGECVVNVIKLQLDVNHDGVMDTSWAGPDNTSYYSPMVFWVNNDFDRTNVVDGDDWEEDDVAATSKWARIPGSLQSSTPDSDFNQGGSGLVIPCKRDLEDYTRIWFPGLAALYTSQSNLLLDLSIRNADTADGPAINLFHAVEANGGTNYLFNETMADLQIQPSPANLFARVSPSAVTHLNDLFLAGGASDYFIFCAARSGKGELVLTVKDGTNVLAETSAWIQFKDIKEMYERWTVGDNGVRAPTNTAMRAVEDLPVGTPAFEYEQPASPNTPYILHVHGWNMERWEKDRFGEAMFKRLYWQGYQGRFGVFRWPTLAKFDVVSWQNPATAPAHFDQSESNSWASGPALKSLLTNLSAGYPGGVYLTAHSMGNIPAGEALRLAGTNQLVNTYVAMQAALSSHAYDTNAPTRSLGLLDDGTPNRYAEYWQSNSPPYFNSVSGAANYVNFFNTNDYALAAVRWQLNQSLKPDGSMGYQYGPPGTWSNNEDEFRRYSGMDWRTLHFPTNTYELFSFCIEARCYALGAQSGVGGVFLTSDEIELNSSPFNFGVEHKYHSGQFRSTNMKRAVFWDELLKTLELKPR